MEKIEMAGAFALSKIFFYEPRLAREVVERFGNASEIFGLDKTALLEIFGPYNKHREALSKVILEREAEELEKICQDTDCIYLSYDMPEFPQTLADCADAPLGFFVKSCDSPSNIFSREGIAVVGTRDMSPYGKEWATKLVKGLASTATRPTIVSGLAFGIDISAQSAALESNLPTIAVLGTGIDNIYPHQHEAYARRIMDSQYCAIISEYPPNTPVVALNFLSRNRIIAGLSRATILVESKLHGGGMSTARTAFSYDREVYAVPGRNDDVRSQGCNDLIHSHIAEPIISCEAFLKDLDYKYKAQKTVDLAFQIRNFYAGSLDDDKIRLAVKLVEIIKKKRGISVDELVVETSIPCNRITSIVNRLESDGFLTVDLLQRCSVS